MTGLLTNTVYFPEKSQGIAAYIFRDPTKAADDLSPQPLVSGQLYTNLSSENLYMFESTVDGIIEGSALDMIEIPVHSNGGIKLLSGMPDWVAERYPYWVGQDPSDSF